MSKPNKIFKSEEGSGLVLVLMVLIVLSVLGSMLGMVTVGSHQLAAHTQEFNSAYYIAESGANIAYEELKQGVKGIAEDTSQSGVKFVEEVDNFIESLEDPFEEENIIKYSGDYFQSQPGGNPVAVVSVEKIDGIEKEGNVSIQNYSIQSVGNIDGKERTVTKDFTITWETKKTEPSIKIPSISPNSAIYFNTKLEFHNHGLVKGDIVYVNNKPFDGTGYDSRRHEPISGSGVISNAALAWSEFEKLANSFPPVPSYENRLSYNGQTNLTITENTYVENLNVSGTLNIDTKGKTVFLIVDDLNVKGRINIIGTGKINIYIKRELTFDGKGKVNISGNTNQINLLYAGSSKVELENFAELNGTLFIKQETVSLEINNHVKINGTIITRGTQVTLKNHSESNATIIAPYAKVILDNHSELFGTVVAREVEGNNHFEVTQVNRVIDEFPFDNTTENDKGSGDGTGIGFDISDIISSKPAIE